VADLLRQSTALVLPSFAEGVPVVMMEAMAAALPVIGPRVAGVPELVAHGVSGLLVAPGDPDALAAAIDQILTDAPLRAAMGAAGRAAVVAGFDSRVEAGRLAALVMGALARDPRLPVRPDPWVAP
jgi:glycosyltransferase involved in cell wall biosynthesis